MKILTCLLFFGVLTAHAGTRSSASYSITADTLSNGGTRTTSAAYTNVGSAGSIVGHSTVASPAETVKQGYIGQLTEVATLQIAASPTTVNEGTSRQLTATATLDDATTSALIGTDVSWSVQSGPLTSISTTGLATAGIVYQNTTATTQGLYFGITGTLNLTVVNMNTDDLPGYSSDGIDDSWQFQYFGLNNRLAIPTADPDFDGQNNLFEFTAGLVPNNSASRFLFDPQPVPAAPGQMRLVLSPRFSDRTYTIVTSPTLGAGAVWTPLTTFTITDNGTTRTVTDTNATGPTKFYRVEVTNP
jgi:hypothetical protein